VIDSSFFTIVMNLVSHQIKNEEVIDTKANCPFLIVMNL
jgi:hypothetical protein